MAPNLSEWEQLIRKAGIAFMMQERFGKVIKCLTSESISTVTNSMLNGTSFNVKTHLTSEYVFQDGIGEYTILFKQAE